MTHHYTVAPGDNWFPIARKLAPSGCTDAQICTFAATIAQRNGFTFAVPAPFGMVLHYNAADIPTPPVVVEPPAEQPAPGQYGPAGRWPAGFPEYATPADAVTDGSFADLQATINSLPGGGVIEHAGNITEHLYRSNGTGHITIRPPLGRRSEFTADTRLRGPGILVAGYRLGSNARVVGAIGSGFAWCEANPNTYLAVGDQPGAPGAGIFYEIVAAEFMPSTSGDRARCGSSDGTQAHMDLVGCYLTGSQNQGHIDTVQVLLSGGECMVRIVDSVIFASTGKALQGDGDTIVYDVSGSWLSDPDYTRRAWQALTGQSLGDGFTTGHAITGAADLDDCVMLGGVHNGFAVTVSNSRLLNAGGIIDAGDNTELSGLELPPPPPTHEQLDAIWHT